MLRGLKILGYVLASIAAVTVAMLVGVVAYLLSMGLWFATLGTLLLGVLTFGVKDYWESRK